MFKARVLGFKEDQVYDNLLKLTFLMFVVLTGSIVIAPLNLVVGPKTSIIQWFKFWCVFGVYITFPLVGLFSKDFEWHLNLVVVYLNLQLLAFNTLNQLLFEHLDLGMKYEEFYRFTIVTIDYLFPLIVGVLVVDIYTMVLSFVRGREMSKKLAGLDSYEIQFGGEESCTKRDGKIKIQ